MSRVLGYGFVVGCLALAGPGAARADGPEDEVVEAVQKLGGGVLRDEKRADQAVLSVSLSGGFVKDADVEILTRLKRVRLLDLDACDVTDAGMASVGKLTSLYSLSLRMTRVGDDGLKALAPLKRLTTLNLDSTAGTDAGMKSVGSLKELRQLDLGRTAVTDVGLKELAVRVGRDLALLD